MAALKEKYENWNLPSSPDFGTMSLFGVITFLAHLAG
jgi:hypothetical protein